MKIDQDMTIYTAAELWQQIHAVLASEENESKECHLDLSGVGEVDTAGAQVLLMAKQMASSNGAVLQITEMSEPVKESLKLLGLDKKL